jgi:hypothetical protein
MSEILYIVPHSAEGWEDFLRLGHRPGEDASWTFSNCQDGDFYQHYPLSALTFTSGGYTQNRDGLACENEGKAGQPLNAKQIANIRRMREDVAKVCPNLRAPLLGAGFREHSELTKGATTCPSGRIKPLYESYLQAKLEGEDDMGLTPEEHATLLTQSAQVTETLQAIFGGTSPARTVAPEDSIMGRLEALEQTISSTPTLNPSDADLKQMAKYAIDFLWARIKESQ